MPTDNDPRVSTARSDNALQWGEPPPNHVSGPIMHDLVARDIQSRSEFGRNKYGTNLRAFNGRDPLKDAYEEALDLAVYLRQCLYERNKREEWMDTGERMLPAVVRGERNSASRTVQMPLFEDPDTTKVIKVDWKEQ